jgi:two-component system NtrC family sensor kinase
MRKDGKRVYTTVAALPVMDEQGNYIEAIGGIQDLTGRRLAEEELERKEELFRSLIENASDAMAILNGDGTVRYQSPSYLQVLGYVPEEETSRSMFDNVHPDDIAWVSEDLARLLQDPSYTSHFELRVRIRDGSWRIIEGVARNLLHHPAIEGIVVNFRDVTQPKQAEKELQESEQRFRALFEASADGILIADLETLKFGYANPAVCKMLGYNEETLTSMGLNDIHPKDELEHIISEFQAQAEGEKTLAADIPCLRSDGTVFYADINSTKTSIDGRECVMGLFRDITERKRMEEQLIVTDRLASVGELASGIAHEINNPLTSIIGFSELLLGRDVPDDIKEDLSIINREAQRAAGVARNLLTFARKHTPTKQAVSVDVVIQKTLELRAYEHRANNIQVNTHFASDLPEVMADAFQLQQVFLNIIINAEYFMLQAHGRGTLTITTERVGDIVRASLADDGPGIAPENLGHILDPFFTTKEVGKGTGLGLSICHGIITEHDGRIYAESQLGKGATLVIELPVAR